MPEPNGGWTDALKTPPDLERPVLALWRPPHCPDDERVVVMARRRERDWEVIVGRLCAGKPPCFNRSVPTYEIEWWRTLAAPDGLKLAKG